MRRWLPQWKSWFKWVLVDWLYRWVPRQPAKSITLQPGVNLIGYAHAEMGLGEALRNTALALQCAQTPFLVRKLQVPLLNRQDNQSMRPFVADYCRYGINCIGINPDLLYYLPRWISSEEWRCRYNVGYWFWELENFPKEWRYAKHLVDEVWVNTEFVANSVRQVHRRVFKIPFAVAFDMPAGSLNRAHFGLPESSFVFLLSYDFNSSAVRKNPNAVIEAFRAAFPDRSADVRLVVKSINGEMNPEALNRVKTSLCDDPRIVWVDAYLSTEEMRGLLNTADAYVSLHRAEGLGLGMAESMYLGKPVIATAYSGNTEFMNSENACMVPYTLVPVKPGEYPYHFCQVWADPDIEVAAEWMQSLSRNSELCARIGKSAAAYMRSHHSMDRMAQTLSDRLEALRRADFK